MKLQFNMETLKALAVGLRRGQVYIYGLLLICLFGYTAYAINNALNVKPAATQSAIQSLPKINFDKKTIALLKQLNAVGGDVPLGDLGTTDPFR